MRFKQHVIFISLVCVLLFYTNIYCQITDSPDGSVANIPVNDTESKVGEYTLPDPLKLADDIPVTDTKIWYEKARRHIIELFQENQSGRFGFG